MITLINYVAHKYEKIRKNDSRSACHCSQVDISLWLVKSYIILQKLNDGDFLIYTVDSKGSNSYKFVEKFKSLFDYILKVAFDYRYD